MNAELKERAFKMTKCLDKCSTKEKCLLNVIYSNDFSEFCSQKKESISLS